MDMCTKLSNNVLEERLRWVLPIVNKQIKLVDTVKVFYGSQRTLERWVSNYKKRGVDGLTPKSTKPHSHPKETSIRVKERIIELRKETRLCARKINYKIIKEGINIDSRTIGKIIKQEGLTRKYRVRKIKYKYIKVPLSLGELVEIDVKYVPGNINGKKYYQFTAIDCASRWRYLKVYENYDNYSAICFLKELLSITSFRIRSIKTDNGSCFTNRYTGYQKSIDPLNPRIHDFDLFCMKNNIIHYLIDPGKPAQNGKVERSHRTDQEHFYDINIFTSLFDLETKIRQWNDRYNDLEHCALNGKTPNEMLSFYQLKKPTNVCA
ncbi:MAG: integrase core domain-containing protein [Endomicrobiaceae bacterium]|nr:integrase core domain-containing protein [Endomicrobiaceae bacterium]